MGYAGCRVFSALELRDFRWATAVVKRLPEKDSKGRLIRCHEVARALQTLLPSYPEGIWELDDGHYQTVEHSWLWNGRGHVLDLYSVARFPVVQLVDWNIHFHRDLFRPGDRRRDIRHSVVRFLRSQAARGVCTRG
jgi:hypothetical protein